MNDSKPNLVSVPASREPLSRLAIDRAVSDLRRGRFVTVRGGGGMAILAVAAEGTSREGLAELVDAAEASVSLAITGRRATVLNLVPSPDRIALIEPKENAELAPELVRDLADPLAGARAADLRNQLKTFTVRRVDRHSAEAAAVRLAKIARLLPAAAVAQLKEPAADDLEGWVRRHDGVLVDAGDVFQYDAVTARSLRRVSEAAVPLIDAAQSRVIAYRPADGGLEHLAIVIGEPDPSAPVLARLHSECFTGDLLGSLRCDCGDQLRGALAEIAAQGSGVLLYLAQEGRGIGLVNKLRAYELQDAGFDTLEANEQLGFDADERVYLPAAQMFRDLGFSRIRLMTNNPEKVAQLSACGVEVVERVDHAFPSNQHNEHYLKTKASRSGHLI